MLKKLTLDRLNLQVRALGTSLLDISNKCGVEEKKLTAFFNCENSLSKSEEESVRTELVRKGWMVFMDAAQLKTSEDLMINLPMMPSDIVRLENTGPNGYFHWGNKSFKRLY